MLQCCSSCLRHEAVARQLTVSVLLVCNGSCVLLANGKAHRQGAPSCACKRCEYEGCCTAVFACKLTCYVLCAGVSLSRRAMLRCVVRRSSWRATMGS